MREFERDGSGSSHRRGATHTLPQSLESCSLVGTRLWDSDITQGLLSRMCSQRAAEQRGGERPSH